MITKVRQFPLIHTGALETPVAIGNWDQHIATASAAPATSTTTSTVTTTSTAATSSVIVGDNTALSSKPADKGNEQHDSGKSTFLTYVSVICSQPVCSVVQVVVQVAF